MQDICECVCVYIYIYIYIYIYTHIHTQADILCIAQVSEHFNTGSQLIISAMAIYKFKMVTNEFHVILSYMKIFKYHNILISWKCLFLRYYLIKEVHSGLQITSMYSPRNYQTYFEFIKISQFNEKLF